MDNDLAKTDNLSEAEIIQRVINGEKALYEKIMRSYNEQLFRISMSIVNDEQAAEDIMQTAYLNAYRQLHHFRQQSSFGTWISRILINESLLHKKRKVQLNKTLMESNDKVQHTETPLESLMHKELKAILEKAVAALPEKYRMVFVMREVQGMSTIETMEALDIGESNVKIRLTRAKEMLRSALQDYWKPGQLYGFDLVRCDVIVNYVMKQL